MNELFKRYRKEAHSSDDGELLAIVDDDGQTFNDDRKKIAMEENETPPTGVGGF